MTRHSNYGRITLWLKRGYCLRCRRPAATPPVKNGNMLAGGRFQNPKI